MDSSFFLALTTITVAAIALYIYKRQRKDELRDAATIILSEIKNSTGLLRGIKERFNPDPASAVLENNIVLEQESWSKYKFMFINLLEQEEWDAVNNFYKHTRLYDDAVRLNGSFFNANIRQTWVSLHSYYLNKLKSFTESDLSAKDISEELKKDVATFRDLYINNQYSVNYYPLKPINDAKYALDNLNLELSTSSVFVRLRKLASKSGIFGNLRKKLTTVWSK